MRKSNLLTAVEVAALTRPGYYPDGAGLYLQISKWRTKSWLFRFERAGRERQMGLGSEGVVSLAGARERADKARRLLLDGHDPIEARDTERAAAIIEAAKQVTFEHCAGAYIKAHKSGWRNEKHAAQWPATLKKFAYPEIGKLPVGAVDTTLVLKVISPIWTTKTSTANRLRGRIEQILDWARVSGYRMGENPARWKGHLDHLLPSTGKVKPVKHRPALSYIEIAALMKELRARDTVSARALEFLILTAARTGEVILARRAEIDTAGKLWTVPSTRTKSGREHRVPLSPRALQILTDLPLPEDPEAFVFSGRAANMPLSNMAMLELMRDLRPKYVPHGFRSTFRDWIAETTSHENIVAEMALAHVVGDEVEAAYRRGDLMQKRRSLMDDWANYCARPNDGSGKVLKFRRKRRIA